MNPQIFCDILFEQKGDVIINGIDFHIRILKYYEYFDSLFRFNPQIKEFQLSNSSNFIFSSACLMKFKKYLYKQQFKWSIDEIDIYFEYINLSKMFELNLDVYDKIFDENILSEITNYNKQYDLQIEYNSKFNDKIHRIYMCAYILTVINPLDINESLSNISIIQLLELNENHPESIYFLAFCHEIGFRTKKDLIIAHKLHEKNWIQYHYQKSFATMNRLSSVEINSEFKSLIKEKMIKFEHVENPLININDKKIMIYYIAEAFEHGLTINDEIIIPKNTTIACKLMLNNFTNNNCKFSMHQYAYYCQYGIGTQIDISNAMNLYKTCYEQYKHLRSLQNLAMCHIMSDIPEERNKGFEYYTKHHNIKPMYYEIGMCYQLGWGVEKNEEKAIAYYNDGYYNHNNERCLHALAVLYFKKDPIKSRELHEICLNKFDCKKSFYFLMEFV